MPRDSVKISDKRLMKILSMDKKTLVTKCKKRNIAVKERTKGLFFRQKNKAELAYELILSYQKKSRPNVRLHYEPKKSYTTIVSAKTGQEIKHKLERESWYEEGPDIKLIPTNKDLFQDPNDFFATYICSEEEEEEKKEEEEEEEELWQYNNLIPINYWMDSCEHVVSKELGLRVKDAVNDYMPLDLQTFLIPTNEPIKYRTNYNDGQIPCLFDVSSPADRLKIAFKDIDVNDNKSISTILSSYGYNLLDNQPLQYYIDHLPYFPIIYWDLQEVRNYHREEEPDLNIFVTTVNFFVEGRSDVYSFLKEKIKIFNWLLIVDSADGKSYNAYELTPDNLIRFASINSKPYVLDTTKKVTQATKVDKELYHQLPPITKPRIYGDTRNGNFSEEEDRHWDKHNLYPYMNNENKLKWIFDTEKAPEPKSLYSIIKSYPEFDDKYIPLEGTIQDYIDVCGMGVAFIYSKLENVNKYNQGYGGGDCSYDIYAEIINESNVVSDTYIEMPKILLVDVEENEPDIHIPGIPKCIEDIISGYVKDLVPKYYAYDVNYGKTAKCAHFKFHDELHFGIDTSALIYDDNTKVIPIKPIKKSYGKKVISDNTYEIISTAYIKMSHIREIIAKLRLILYNNYDEEIANSAKYLTNLHEELRLIKENKVKLADKCTEEWLNKFSDAIRKVNDDGVDIINETKTLIDEIELLRLELPNCAIIKNENNNKAQFQTLLDCFMSLEL